MLNTVIFTFKVQRADTAVTTIIVPDDYPSIQEAVNSAQYGDTIFVRSGTYYEVVVVNKSVSIIGENPETTVIDGEGGSILRITADCVKVVNLTLQNANRYPEAMEAIQMENVSYCNITRNIITNNFYGVQLVWCSNNFISLNNFTRNSDPISLSESSDNIVSENNVENNDCGIYLIGSPHNVVSGNKLSGNFEGVALGQPSDAVQRSDYNLVCGNRISGCSVGIYLGGSGGVASNNVVGNVMTECLEYGGLVIDAGSVDNTISRNNVTNNHWGIWAIETSNNLVHHNNFINNSKQVVLGYSGLGMPWDNGYPSGGNYWSDYSGEDLCHGLHQDVIGSDGIGDTPYILDSANRDNYPLMSPYVPFPCDLNCDGFVDISDVLQVCLAFGSTPEHSRWDPDADVTLDNRVRIDDVSLVANSFGSRS